MEFQPVTKSVEMFGISETRAMTVASSAKVFYTLISGLYSRKIESICREIISNAYDGHAKRGNIERPFHVHSPTVWEPWFAVRDYGCSINHDTVLNNCSQIGWSSKEKSNTEIGTWGYGMKSPFAYTSQFTITCCLDGQKRVYSYHIDEEGVPQIALRNTRDSDEEQGVEVRFDVKLNDIDAFRQAIRWVALPYKTCFTTNLERVSSAVVSRDEGSFFLTNDAHGLMVEVGPVWYKIELSQLRDCAAFADALRGYNLVLRSQIGELGIVPSRESLEYTPKTVANLTRLLKAVFDHLKAKVEAEMSGVTNVWTAATVYRTLNEGPIDHIAAAYQTPWGTLRDLTNFYTDIHDLTTVQVVQRLGRYVTKRRQASFSRGISTAVFVFDQACPSVSKINKRMAAYMLEHGIDTAMAINLPCPKTTIDSMIASLERNSVPRAERKIKLNGVYASAKELREKCLKLIADYGCPVVIYQNDLPEALCESKRKASPISVYENRNGRSKWEKTIATPHDNKLNIVFELDRHEFYPMFEDREIKRLIKQITNMEVGDIIGVSKSNLQKFCKLNPYYTPWTGVFTRELIDVDAMVDRITKINATMCGGSGKSINEGKRVQRVQRVLEKQLSVIPEPVKRVVIATCAAEQDDNRRLMLANTLNNGLSSYECELLIQLVTGSKPKINKEPYFDMLGAAINNLNEVYPELMNHITGLDDGRAAAIYILGLDALRALQAASFYDIDECA